METHIKNRGSSSRKIRFWNSLFIGYGYFLIGYNFGCVVKYMTMKSFRLLGCRRSQTIEFTGEALLALHTWKVWSEKKLKSRKFERLGSSPA
jgi:hypothetical protein